MSDPWSTATPHLDCISIHDGAKQPAAVYSSVNGRYRDAFSGGVFRSRQEPISHSYPERDAAVFRLLKSSGPLAIARLVVTVVVHALDRVVAGRSRPHVFVERPETVTPALTNLDPSAAPQAKLRVVRIVAAILHRLPCAILGRLAQSVGPTSHARPLPLNAPTTQRRASAKISGVSHCRSATFTDAGPASLTPFALSTGRHGKAAEHLAYQVEVSHAARYRKGSEK